MLRSSALAALAVVLVGLALSANSAAAQPWYERYNRGLELEEQGQWEAALAEFQGAAALRPFPAKRARTYGRSFVFDYDPHYHMARCLVEMGRPGLAAQQLKRAANARVTPFGRLQELRRRIEEMTGEKPAPARGAAGGELTVQSDPSGANVWVDGVSHGTTPLGPLALSPGSHALRVEAVGRPPVERTVTVAAGTTETVLIQLLAASSTPVPAQSLASPTQVTTTFAQAVPTTSEETPVAVRTIEIPEGRRFPKMALALAALVVLAVSGLLLLRSGRRRQPPHHAATEPTRVLDQATTLIESGLSFGGYEVQEVLGRGGMATTYRGRRAGDGRTAAIKVPHDSCLADQSFVTRFLREGRLGEQLHHPRIVRILGAGEENGRPYLAMELITGRTLKEELRAVGPLPLRRALEIARDIAEALDYAHAKGVVHRDLKPENVMTLPDGTVKVMDFGIARLATQPSLTTTNVFLGTPAYAAPEMVDPKRVDDRADLYALGIILYEMLEGTVPFTADSPYRILEMHQHAPMPAREALARRVPPRVWAVVQRLCEKDPEARYQKAEALLVELNRLLQSLHELEGNDVF